MPTTCRSRRCSRCRRPDPATADRAVALAEQFFIITHQSCELWLKQIVADLDAAERALRPPGGTEDLELSVEFLMRTTEVLRLLHGQLLALEKLPIRHFAEFRPHLDTASGAQSAQFRQMSRLLGDEQKAGRLYEAFAASADYHGYPVPEVCRLGVERRHAAPRRRGPAGDRQRLLALEGRPPGPDVQDGRRPGGHGRHQRP